MKEAIEKFKNEFNTNLQRWHDVKSVRIKIALIILFVAVVGLKAFTTVLTFDWLAGLF
jgi:hypothetical protein